MKRIAFVLVAGAALLGSGCATKKYVGQEVATVNTRVDDVQGQVEEAQQGLRRHDEALTRHDQSLTQHGQQIQQTSKTAQEALDRATAAGKLAEGKLLYEVTLTDDKIRFAFNRADLSPEGREALTTFANGLKEANKSVYVEIQGHTDGVGSEDYNYQLGLDRAEAVRRFLNMEGGLPLHRMAVISYGKAEPIAGNDTREGRSQNRRVVLVVLQ